MVDCRRYKALGITNTKKPFTTHLWWEHATYGLYFVPHDDQTKLLKTINKGSSNTIVTDQTQNIQAGWLDGNDLWLLLCNTNEGGGDLDSDDNFTVIYIEMDNGDNVITIGSSSGADVGSVRAYDIFKIGVNFYVIEFERRIGPTYTARIYDVDTAPFVLKASTSGIWGRGTLGVVIGTKYYFISDEIVGPNITSYIYDDAIPSLTRVLESTSRRISPNQNLRGIAYDGDDTIYAVITNAAQTLNLLSSYSISGGTWIWGSEYNIALQLDRNNVGTAPK